MQLPVDPVSSGVVAIPVVANHVTQPIDRAVFGKKVARWTPPSPPPIPSPPSDTYSDSSTTTTTTTTSSSSSTTSSSTTTTSSSTTTTSSFHTGNSADSATILSTISINNLGNAGSSPAGSSPSLGVSNNDSGSGNTSTSSSKSGLKPAVIGGIVGGAVLALLLALFLTRQWYIRRRQQRRAQSGAFGWIGSADEKSSVTEGNAALTDPEVGTIASEVASSNWSFHVPSVPLKGPVAALKKHHKTMSLSSINSVTSVDTSHERHMSTGSVDSITPLRPLILVTGPDGGPDLQTLFPTPIPSSTHTSYIASDAPPSDGPYIPARMVKPFIQTMPDELRANIGEKVGILKEYDDGWSLCVTLNSKGAALEPGMVPTECLEKLENNAPVSPAAARNQRMSRRESSMNFAMPKRRESLPID